MAVCNRDCFNCPYPDCIVDDMSRDEYRESAERSRDLESDRKTDKEKKLAAKAKAYYEANKEEIAAKAKAYREATGYYENISKPKRAEKRE